MNNASHYGCPLVRFGIFATTKQGRVKQRIAICLRGGFQQKEKYHRFSQLFFHSFCFCWPADVTKIRSFSARATVAPFISSFISPLHHHSRALRAISIHPSLLRVSGLFGAPLPSILSTAIFERPISSTTHHKSNSSRPREIDTMDSDDNSVYQIDDDSEGYVPEPVSYS